MIIGIPATIEAKTARPKNVKVHPYPAAVMKGWTEYENAKLINELHMAKMTTISPATPGKHSIAYAVAMEQALI
jgi:hypothetical protein